MTAEHFPIFYNGDVSNSKDFFKAGHKNIWLINQSNKQSINKYRHAGTFSSGEKNDKHRVCSINQFMYYVLCIDEYFSKRLKK